MKRDQPTEPDPSTARAAPLDPLAARALEILIDALLRQHRAEEDKAAHGHD